MSALLFSPFIVISTKSMVSGIQSFYNWNPCGMLESASPSEGRHVAEVCCHRMCDSDGVQMEGALKDPDKHSRFHTTVDFAYCEYYVCTEDKLAPESFVSQGESRPGVCSSAVDPSSTTCWRKPSCSNHSDSTHPVIYLKVGVGQSPRVSAPPSYLTTY